MGKIDDMRRLREQQFADRQQRTANHRAVDVVVPAPRSEAPVALGVTSPADSSPRPQPRRSKTASESKSGVPLAEEGRCAGCGKMKPVSGGVVANHQKGLGKACAGSRKKPV